MYRVSLSLTRLFGRFIVLLAAFFTGYAYAGNWNNGGEFDYFNDFSQRIYHDGASWNETGPYPKAAKIIDEELVVTITPEMLDVGADWKGRYELEKDDISKSLAVYQKFRVKSDNNYINDRVMIGQIKYYKKKAGPISPMAGVFLDRYPKCVTYTRTTEFPLGHSDVTESLEHGVRRPLHLYVELKAGVYHHEWMAAYHNNRPLRLLNDGEWHTVEMDVYPHPSMGYCIIKIDGKVYTEIIHGPTKSYFRGQHKDYAARIGIYRDAVNHNHTVRFDDWKVKAYKPDDGPILILD